MAHLNFTWSPSLGRSGLGTVLNVFQNTCRLQSIHHAHTLSSTVYSGCPSRRSTTATAAAAASPSPSASSSNSASKANESDLERAKSLTKRIVACEDASSVLDGLLSNKDDINFRHLSTAMLKIAKLERAARAPPRRLIEDTRFTWLVDRLIACRDEPWPTVSVANLLQACTMINHHRCTELQSKAEQELRRPERVYNNIGLISVLHSLAKLPNCSVSKEFFVPKVQQAILGHARQQMVSNNDGTDSRTLEEVRLSHFTTQDLGPLAYALCELECSSEAADALFVEASNRGLQSMPPRSLAMVARTAADRGSDAGVKHAVRALCAVILSRSQNPRGAAPLSEYDVAMLFFAFAKLVRRLSDDEFRSGFGTAVPKWTTAIVRLQDREPTLAQAADVLIEAMHPMIPTFGEQALTSVSFGLALLQRHPNKPPVLVALEKRALTLLPSFEFSRIPRLCWSFAHLRYDSEVLMETAASTMLHKLNTASHSLSSGKQAESLGTSLATTLHAFAVLNRFNGPFARKLLPILVSKVAEMLPGMSPALIATVGWALVVAKGGPGTLPPDETQQVLDVLRLWRTAVAEKASHMPAGALPMLHHVEVTLRVEAPDLGMDAPEDYVCFFQSLYSTGRMRGKGSQAWDSQIQAGTQRVTGPKRSAFQKQVDAAARLLAPDAGWVCEYWDPTLSYPLDIALPSLKLGIEADGPTHYALNTLRPLGATALKRRLLPQLGWTLVDVPFFEWSMSQGRRKGAAYLEQKLEEAGIDIELLYSRQQVGDQAEAEEKRAVLPDVVPVDAPIVDTVVVSQNSERLNMVRLTQGKMSKADLLRKRVARSSAGGSNGGVPRESGSSDNE